MNQISVEVQYFALLKDRTGLDSEQFFLSERTISGLFLEVQKAHKLELDRGSFRVAVNDSFVPWESVLADGDTVVFIPPMSGG